MNTKKLKTMIKDHETPLVESSEEDEPFHFANGNSSEESDFGGGQQIQELEQENEKKIKLMLREEAKKEKQRMSIINLIEGVSESDSDENDPSSAKGAEQYVE